MCGCTWVGRPAAMACCFRRRRSWLGVSRVPRWLTNSAGSSGSASRSRTASQACSARSAGRRPARCAACRPCPAHGPGRRRCRSSRRARAGAQVQPQQFGDAQAAAVQQLDDAVVAHAERRIRTLRHVAAVLGQRHRLVDRERLRQRLGRLRCPHAFDRIGGHPAIAAEPAVVAPPGRQGDRDAARRQAEPVQLRRPAANVMGLDLAQRHVAPRRQSAAGARRPRHTSPACARPAAARHAGEPGAAPGRRPTPRREVAARSRTTGGRRGSSGNRGSGSAVAPCARRAAPAATSTAPALAVSPMRCRKSMPMSAEYRVGSGEPSTIRPKVDGRRCHGAAESSPATDTGRVGEPATPPRSRR